MESSDQPVTDGLALSTQTQHARHTCQERICLVRSTEALFHYTTAVASTTQSPFYMPGYDGAIATLRL